jgi:hypothetical protein
VFGKVAGEADRCLGHGPELLHRWRLRPAARLSA